MKLSLNFLFAVILAASLRAAAPAPSSLKIEIPAGPQPWTNLKIDESPGRFQFAIVSDRTGGHRGHVFQDGIKKLNLLQPDLVMSVGDMIEGYSTDPAEIGREWDEYSGFISRLKMPFFYVPGNHDVQNPVELAEYHKRFGKDYYHFVYKNVLFLCINSDDPFPAKISVKQTDEIAQALKDNKDVRWTLLFFHRPLWVETESKDTGWEKVEALLKGRPYTVFTGHTHHYKKYIRNDQRYIVLATTGAGSDMRGPAFGEFDHTAWVTMTDAGPLVANVMLDGVWDENIVTEKSSGLMERLNNSVPVQEGSLFMTEKSIHGASVKLRCTNKSDLPLRVKLNFYENSALVPDPALIETVVQPNSVKIFDLPLKAVGELNVADLKSIPYDWTLSYDHAEAYAPLRIQGTSRLYVDGPLDLPAVPKPVVVDGKLDEWGPLPIVCENSRPPQAEGGNWTGPKDCSFKFAVRHDDKNFYVAVQVTDDLRLAASREDPYNQDGIWITLDTEPELNKARGPKEQKNSFAVMLLPGKNVKESYDVARAQGWASPGVEGVCIDTKKGFNAEAVIPFAALAQRLGKPAQAIKVNVTVYDFDPSESQDKALYFNWRPVGGGEYPGQGSFYLR
jgi:predicted phosphodiesterase